MVNILHFMNFSTFVLKKTKPYEQLKKSISIYCLVFRITHIEYWVDKCTACFLFLHYTACTAFWASHHFNVACKKPVWRCVATMLMQHRTGAHSVFSHQGKPYFKRELTINLNNEKVLDYCLKCIRNRLYFGILCYLFKLSLLKDA